MVDFYKQVHVAACDPAEERDYLHYEGGDSVPYFERIVYALPDEIDPQDPDHREKLSLIIGPEFQAALAKVQNQPKGSVNLWSMDFTDADAFAAAVRAEPSFQAVAEWGKIAGEVTFEELM